MNDARIIGRLDAINSIIRGMLDELHISNIKYPEETPIRIQEIKETLNDGLNDLKADIMS
jgi:hypothetical protein